MENNQPKKKSAGLTALIALLLIITTVASCLGIYAWAKYISSQGGNATAQVAKWHFELRNGTSQVESGKQLLALTRTDGYGHVATGKLAPGTFGEFLLEIDTTGTEVTMTYDVDITVTGCPENLLFYTSYTDENTNTPLEKTAAAGGAVNLHISKYLSLDSSADNYVNKVQLEKIYWRWPYETPGGDAQDTEDSDNTVEMNILVTGTEVLEEPGANAGGNASAIETPGTVAYEAHNENIGVGDLVNYNPGNGEISDDDLILTGAKLIGDTRVASIDGASLQGSTISANDAPAVYNNETNWRVLSVDKTNGTVTIVPKHYSSTTLQLSGMDGYNNAIAALDKVASIYKNDTYAESSRSLTVEDVNDVTGHTPDGEDVYYSWENDYGMDASTLDIVQNGGDTISVATETQGKTIYLDYKKYTSTPKTGYYSYAATGFDNWSCWLASRCVALSSDSCSFDVRILGGGSVNYHYLFGVHDDGSTDVGDGGYPVVPVVTLKSDIHMTKDNNNTWILSQN